MIMRGKYDDIEDVKLEVTMFDGYVTVPKLGDDASGEDVRLHISFIVDVSKGDGGENLEFLCSAWPDRLEIQKVYLLRGKKMPGRPYMGPDFRCGPFFPFLLMIVVLVFVLQLVFARLVDLGLD